MAQWELNRVIVIGASAGGQEALCRLVAQLPLDLPAAFVIVNPISPGATGDALVRALDAAGPLTCGHARHHDPIAGGQIYVAPPDHHLLIDDARLILTRGARENRSRPAIAPLFRAAAVACGASVIGVILAG